MPQKNSERFRKMFEHLEKFKRERESAPKIKYRLTFFAGDMVPMRAYFHEFGFEEAYGSKSDLEYFTDHFYKLIDKFSPSCPLKNSDILGKGDYIIALFWGNNSDKIVDVFRYSDIDEWPGNPNVESFILKNGIYQPDNHEISCGDGTIIIGKEEQYRRKTKDLEDFLKFPPNITGLSPRKLDKNGL